NTAPGSTSGVGHRGRERSVPLSRRSPIHVSSTGALRIKMHNKLVALVVLNKYLGMFDERTQNSNVRPNGFNRLQEIKTMTVYVIADNKVTDDGWVPAYAASVHDIVHKHGGKYLSRSGNVKTLEGKPLDTTFIALLEFPSAEAVKAFATDPKYAPHAAA